MGKVKEMIINYGFKYGVTECDGKMYYVLCSEFGACGPYCQKILQNASK
jgi:hypothetical protein